MVTHICISMTLAFAKEVLQREVLLQFFEKRLDTPAPAVRLTDLLCRHLLRIKYVCNELNGIPAIVSSPDYSATAVCSLHTLLHSDNTRIGPSATAMPEFLLCHGTLYILVIRKLYNLVCDDVFLRTLSLLDDFESGIILQATDKLVAGFIKPFP